MQQFRTIADISEYHYRKVNANTLMQSALAEIAKCEVSQQGSIAMKHIAEKALINADKIIRGVSLEGERNVKSKTI